MQATEYELSCALNLHKGTWCQTRFEHSNQWCVASLATVQESRCEFCAFGSELVAREVLFLCFLFESTNFCLWETCGTLEVDPPPDDWCFNINLICLGSSPPAMGKAEDFLFPAQSDEEVYTERLLLGVKCLIQKAFLLCHPEPPWQICLPSKNRMKGGMLVS